MDGKYGVILNDCKKRFPSFKKVCNNRLDGDDLLSQILNSGLMNDVVKLLKQTAFKPSETIKISNHLGSSRWEPNAKEERQKPDCVHFVSSQCTFTSVFQGGGGL